MCTSVLCVPMYVCTVCTYFLCIKVQGIVAMHQVQGDGSAESVSSSMGVSPMCVPPLIHLHIRTYVHTYVCIVHVFIVRSSYIIILYGMYYIFTHTYIHVYLMFILYKRMHKLKVLYVCWYVRVYVCTVLWYF